MNLQQFLHNLLLSSAFLALCQSASAETEGDFEYFINDSAARIAKYNGTEAVVTIPEKIGGLPVRTIDKGIFLGNENLTGAKIPSGVTSHEPWGCQAYDRLASITVDPANPSYCAVDGVLFDKNRTTLLKYPSKKTDQHYDIPEGVTHIGLAAFNGASCLASVTIPASVTSMGANNFGGYQSLTSVSFLGNAPKFEGTVFYRTPGEITIRHFKGATGFVPPDYPWGKRGLVEIDPTIEVFDWRSTDDRTVKGKFLKLAGETVVVEKEDGRQVTIPFTKLAPASVSQAKALGKATSK